MWSLLLTLILLPASCFCFRWWIVWNTRVCHSKVSLAGKTAIVTGANTGIGFCTAKDLARRNARVILACRNADKATQAVQEIRKETGNINVTFKQLDTSSLASVRRFVAEVTAEEPSLHILVNNAGVSAVPFVRTDEGFEPNMATNHFGPFLLTNLLLDLLKKSAPARIVNVSSVVHGWASGLDFENLNAEKYFTMATIYFHTKLANVLFSRELSKRLQGTGVTVNSLHPGTVQTHLLRHLNPFLRFIISDLIGGLFFKSPETGAQTSIYCAVSEEVEGISGKYFDNCQIKREASVAQDDEAARKLWVISEKYTGLSTSES